MSKVSTYLNFSRNTEEAFNFYKHVFESEFIELDGKTISRMGDIHPGIHKVKVVLH